MEHPQQRLLGTQGRKPTHDFLSLYSPAQQDPSAATTTPSGSYLETHDFLQPLERVGKNVAKEENKVEESSIGKPLPPTPPTTVEHILPGGIGTYSISHISVINQSQRMPKPEGVGVVITGAQSSGSDKNDENSNCSSYTGSGFSLWEESAVKKGKTGKENIAGNRHVIREGGMKMGGMPWMTSMERPSQSSSAHNHPTATISSLSSSRPSSAQKNPSFVDMLKSAKSVQEDEDEEVEEFVIKKEPSTHYKGVLSVKVDTAHHDQKPNTPRSKHSATEQRRRSKINDRFSMLRELIPHGDQKRDKASFLLEVIEYIQFLQEKVHKFEDSCRGWPNEQPAMTPWNNNQRPTEGFIDQPRVQNGVSGSALPYASKLNENKHSVALNLPKKDHQNILDSDLSSLETMKDIGQHPRLTNLASPFPSPLQPNVYSPGCGSTSVAAPPPSTLPSDTTNTPSQLWQSRSCTTDCTVAGDKSKDQDLTIESGTISISTIYSQGLLSTLTQALQSSGVDLSEANISVQIDLGKRANTSRRDSSTPIFKKNEAPVIDENLTRSRLASTREEKNDNDLKRFKTSRN
ncbi:basic helix-loop-helix (bHLH) DNA-binding superfamily protein [Artemisia annua]|uniref:Basic helix-loop-helix (BHLH) DNA-binding superfamily protein n=1 Tax=Artemisia annua TaxID=35608 RepID=A0A2U1MRX0_ARTAN|nr:basic helix-loop-helix (bHLH) DNA-binding superfamily protein [Artemisia annua]